MWRDARTRMALACASLLAVRHKSQCGSEMTEPHLATRLSKPNDSRPSGTSVADHPGALAGKRLGAIGGALGRTAQTARGTAAAA